MLRFDDPALVATLASQASQYARGQDDRQYALQLADSARADQQQAMQYDMQRRQMDLQVQSLAGRQTPGPAPQAPEAPGGTEVLPNGATIYHPAGSQVPQTSLPTQQAGGGRGGIGKFGQLLAGGGYVTPLQRKFGESVDAMEAAGQLDPAEAVRMRMIVLAGQNPFEQPTQGEQQRLKTRQNRADTLSEYQRATLEDRGADNRRADSKEQRDVEDHAYKRQRDAIKDELEIVLKQIANLPLNADTKALDGKLEQLQAKLRDLPATFKNPTAGGGAGAAGSTNILGDARPEYEAQFAASEMGRAERARTAPPSPAGGGLRVEGNAITNLPGAAGTPDPADIAFLVKKYGTDAAAARAAYQRGERAPR